MIGLFAAFLVNIFLLNKLNLSLYGLYVYYISVIQISSNLVTGGLNGYIGRYFPDRLSTELNQKTSNDTALLLILIIKSILAAIILSLLITEAERRTLIIAAFFFQATRLFWDSILKATLNNEVSSKMSLTAILLRNALIVVFLDSITLELLLKVEIWVHAVWLAIGIGLLLKRKIKLHLNLRVSFNSEMSVFELRYLALSWFNEILNGATNRSSDILFVRYFAEPHFLGIYSLALKTYEYIVKILPSKEVLVYVRTYMLASVKSNGMENVIKEYQNLFYYVSLIYMIPVTMFFLAGELFIRDLYHVEEYSSVYLLTCILLSYQLNYALFYHQSLFVIFLRKIEYSLYTRLIYPIVLISYLLIEKEPSMQSFAIITVTCELFRNLLISIVLSYLGQNVWNREMAIGFVGLVVLPMVTGLALHGLSYVQVLLGILIISVYMFAYVHYVGYGNVKQSIENVLVKIGK